MTESDETGPSRNHYVWLGPLIALPGFLSYFMLFSKWPAFRDTGWLNLLILAGALTISVIGLRRAWSGGVGRRVAGVAGTVFTAFFAALLPFYIFSLSYSLPDASEGAGLGERIPAITLASYDGSSIDLGAPSDDPLILVFYRGFW